MAIAFDASKKDYVKNKSMGLTAQILDRPGDGEAAWCSQQLPICCLVSFLFL